MVISVEDMFVDGPVMRCLASLLSLNDETHPVHFSFSNCELCVYSAGRLIKFIDIGDVLVRANAAAVFSEHFTDSELNEPKRFILCTVSYNGAVVKENYVVSEWFMDYMEMKSRYKHFSREKNKVLLFVSHFHEKGEDGQVLPPHFHVLYNDKPRENATYYSCYSD